MHGVLVRSVSMRLLLFVLVLVALTACGSTAAAPTATATKTPVEVQEVVEPTATPVPPTPTEVVVALVPTDTPTPLPGNIAPYSGLPADNPENLKRRPVLICINNDSVGRSAHYGLGLADVVYEYIVDGFTLTRITAIYQGQSAERVGPVRSARMPNVWITYMYDGILACSGGSDEVRYLLKNEVGFPYLDADIDDLTQDGRYFFSIGSAYQTRMQASTDGVRRWEDDRGLTKEWSRPGFQFSQEPPANAVGTATSIQISYPGGNGVEWRYDPGLGGYIRFQGGVQQFDPALNGQPIVAKNVIVQAAVHELTDIVEDSLGTKGVDIKLYGFGDFRIFRDGQVYEGTWRADPEGPPRFLGPGEVIVQLKPGQSWIQVVREIGELTYQ
ncbi:MAG: DUF3048 domain-containing protein [Caldilineaceae bacterium]|nr:DUF3048 domain-containing protein [Caldilineaceae bacterium]